MDQTTRTHLDNIRSTNKDLQNQAYAFLMDATAGPVDWAYEAWDDLVASLVHRDNKTRAIAAQVLANLVQSDPDGHVLKDFEALLNVTRDERFVTARHCMQSIWKVGLAGPSQRQALVDGLERRFHECAAEKNCTLIRYDILKSLRDLYDRAPDPAVREAALALIETEEEPKYRKKYSGVWKSA